MQAHVAPQQTPPLVRVAGVTKRFGGVRALRGVHLDVQPGEVHALLGENGAGKSTLIKILSGVQAHDEGSIELDGRLVSFESPARSREAGIAVVYQELSLVESLSVGANLLLGREPRTRLGLLRKRRGMAEAAAFLRASNLPLDPYATVGSLSFANRQMTEIAKALMGNVRLLILDEPTSALTGGEEQILFDAIGRVTARGVGVIYVTHRLNEVFRVSHRVTVFRDGVNAGTFTTKDTTMRELVAAIVGPGHALTETVRAAVEGDVDGGTSQAPNPRAPTRATTGEPILTLADVANERVRGADLTVRAGEIHGLAGLVGSGRTEILQTVFGIRRVGAGDIRVEGTSLAGRTPADIIDLGVALVPEDRHQQGLVLDHSIERNLTLPRLARFSRWGWLRKRASLRQARAAIATLSVKAPGPFSIVRTLSGGNQQKVVFAKWTHPRPRVLLLDEPTAGVDVGAREEIYGVVRAAARAGSGVLVVSSDFAELLLLCDVLSIVVDGRVVRTMDRDEVGGMEELHHMVQRTQAAEAPA